MKIRNFVIVLFLFFCFGYGLQAQISPNNNLSQTKTRILFIFDASNSMWGDWQSDKKIHIANKLLSKMIDSLEQYPNVELALRVYGHQKEFKLYDCNDTKLEVPFAPNNFQRIQQKLKSIYPKGTTPISLSLAASENDFPQDSNARNIIILITDGIEECSGDPCAVSQALQKKGIILKPFIIGIGSNFSVDLSCIGNYIDASSEKEFDQALTIIIEQIFNKTTCQVNLLDANGNPVLLTDAERENYLVKLKDNYRKASDAYNDELQKLLYLSTDEWNKLVAGKSNIADALGMGADGQQKFAGKFTDERREFEQLRETVRKDAELARTAEGSVLAGNGSVTLDDMKAFSKLLTARGDKLQKERNKRNIPDDK